MIEWSLVYGHEVQGCLIAKKAMILSQKEKCSVSDSFYCLRQIKNGLQYRSSLGEESTDER